MYLCVLNITDTEHILSNTWPHQLCQGDQDMGTTLSCKKTKWGDGLACMVGKRVSKVVSLSAAVILSLKITAGASLRGIHNT